jgi:hypothetical protein
MVDEADQPWTPDPEDGSPCHSMNKSKIDFPSPIHFFGTEEELLPLFVNGQMKEWYPPTIA